MKTWTSSLRKYLMETADMNRRNFLAQSAAAGAAYTLGGISARSGAAASATGKSERIRVGLIGCGSVSGVYLPNLEKCPFVELVSTCDIIPERAERRAREHNIGHHYPHIDKMLAGEPFDLLIDTTDMQEHEHLNRQAIEAGKHVWSEKPIANSLAAGQAILADAVKRNVRIWGAPIVVASPQFAFMAKTLAAGTLGRIASAHADYGHTGPDWSAFFYQKGGGSMPDLGVYNLTSLTGLLGPARAVTAMTSIVTPTREIQGKGTVKVTEEDNAMVLMDHGNGVLSHVQCGFNFFNPHGHEGSKETRHTISIFGSRASLGLVGYDWEPLGVDLATAEKPEIERHSTDRGGYVWQQGASLVAECLATGKEPLFTPEHALHVLEIIVAARDSQQTGRRIDMQSTFKWPIIA
jgi:predicted dehydrogenase